MHKDKFLKKITWTNLGIIFVGFLVILLKQSSLPNFVPLFYSRPWGEEQLAAKNWLFLIPSSSFVIFVFGNQIGRLLWKKNGDFLPFVLNGISLLFSVLGIVTLLKIIFLVT
ncbi:MAG: hypothetical protein COS76_03790 [Candidatus Portnoybacteria bacterium CG06_land_8_20_14_3_00_39_12]|uniref:DUF1648 domain-containing protein n=1 Tax=Candidatus Portnoybacteria bacterium CG06_land_8_20_14_3_00_39_12 TaxID=1974809 RepID=A0A2M7AW66_9BACT|nr:MAG: hypothetical protein COS76_03790 [Candidatus Portnoybacteria bacterium CG06_land_8_20_14_3_00_39_12]